jgi:hypothetical protein
VDMQSWKYAYHLSAFLVVVTILIYIAWGKLSKHKIIKNRNIEYYGGIKKLYERKLG